MMFRKYYKQLSNTRGQALLLVIISSFVFLTIVLGIVERTNKQLTIQRQNAEYQVSLTNAQGAVAGLVEAINRGDVSPLDSSQPANDGSNRTLLEKKLYDANLIPDLVSGGANLKVDLTDFGQEKPFAITSDSSLNVEPVFKKSVTKITAYCNVTLTNSVIVLQPVYYDVSSNPVTDTIVTDCNNNQNVGTEWSIPDTGAIMNLPGGYQGRYEGTKNITDSNNNIIRYKTYSYALPASKQNIANVRVIPKSGFGGGVVENSVIVRLYNSLDIIGATNPLTGTAVGYGKNGRSATIRFTTPNAPQLPTFLQYVFFTGQ